MVGSFLNCLIYRLETNQNFLGGRSFCPLCQHQLGFWDLIPVFSFLFLKGRCRYCHQKISFQYPLVELVTAIIFLLISLTANNIFTMMNLFLLSCFLLIIFLYDFKHYIIPDKIIYPAIVIALLYQVGSIGDSGFISNSGFPIPGFKILINPLLSAFLAGGFFLTLVFFSRGKWMGIGDVKLAFLMGLFLGFPNLLVALFLAFLIGAIIGIGLIITGKKTLKSEVPFGPFLISGTFLALFWGEKIFAWYLDLFG